MKSIELLGSSGVGKTFLYQKLFETYSERTYMNVREACVKAAGSLKTSFGFNGQYLYSVLFRSGFFSQKSYGLSRKLLLSQHKDWNEEIDYSLSFSLLKRHLSTEENSEVVTKRKENFKHCIRLRNALKNTLSNDQVVFYDEGALHHHHGLKRSIASEYTFNEIRKDDVLTPYAVIFLELPFEKHMTRIIERKEKGINTFSHGKLSGRELETYVEGNIAAYQEKIQTLKMLDVPVLHINAEREMSENLNHINGFINKLTNHA